jgi:hypothetical protein
MYTDRNFKTKKALKTAVAQGDHIGVYSPGGLGTPPQDGTTCVEGPHYPEPHRWYATVTMEGGRIIKVK